VTGTKPYKLYFTKEPDACLAPDGDMDTSCTTGWRGELGVRPPRSRRPQAAPTALLPNGRLWRRTPVRIDHKWKQQLDFRYTFNCQIRNMLQCEGRNPGGTVIGMIGFNVSMNLYKFVLLDSMSIDFDLISLPV
jgi:hypothetical protein